MDYVWVYILLSRTCDLIWPQSSALPPSSTFGTMTSISVKPSKSPLRPEYVEVKNFKRFRHTGAMTSFHMSLAQCTKQRCQSSYGIRTVNRRESIWTNDADYKEGNEEKDRRYGWNGR
jgi:hypothetical protein